MEEKVIERELSFAKLTIKFTKVGKDYHILLQGGDSSHIGCTVLALPRLPLRGMGDLEAQPLSSM